MLELNLDADQVLRSEPTFFQRLNKYQGLYSKFKRLALSLQAAQWVQVPPIIVLKHPEIKDIFMVYNGNHRTSIAKRYNLQLKAILIETPDDFKKIQSTRERAEWGSTLKETIDYIKAQSNFVEGEIDTLIQKPCLRHEIVLD